jgi:hypothetical protein
MLAAKDPRPLWTRRRALIRRLSGGSRHCIEHVFDCQEGVREKIREDERAGGRGAEPREEAERSGQAIRRSYTRGTMAKRIRFRPPGLKPTTKVGTLGPYRGRLGFAWVIAPVFAGIAIVLAGWLLLR